MEAREITPVDVVAAFPPQAAPLASMAPAAASSAPTRLERFLRNPRSFWATEFVLFAPAGMFWVAGLLHELGRKDLAEPINNLLFDPSHSIVRDMIWPVVLPACAIVLAVARIRDAKPGKDRMATIGIALAGLASLGMVVLYAIVEAIGHFSRGG